MRALTKQNNNKAQKSFIVFADWQSGNVLK